jgi:hypothetical protein
MKREMRVKSLEKRADGQHLGVTDGCSGHCDGGGRCPLRRQNGPIMNSRLKVSNLKMARQILGFTEIQFPVELVEARVVASRRLLVPPKKEAILIGADCRSFAFAAMFKCDIG